MCKAENLSGISSENTEEKITENIGAAGKSGGKSNKAFMILSALGILFVVDAHTWGKLFLAEIFPYDSFFMPMFVFISGYFFKEKYVSTFKTAGCFILKKIQKLLLPFFGWTVFYGLLVTVLNKIGIINLKILDIGEVFTKLVTTGTTYGYNDPSWFVPLLFFICLVYCLMRKLLFKVWNDIAAAAVLVLIGATAVYFTKTEYNVASNSMWLKTAFFMQFYQLGIVFRKFIEPLFDKINTILFCFSAATVNIFLMMIYGNEIAFPNCAFMSGFKTGNYFLPLITTLTGTLFWLKISKALAGILGDNKLINFISDNTFFIMTNHLIFKSLFTGFLILGKKYGISSLSGVDVIYFKSSAWYLYLKQPWCQPAYFLFTVAATLTVCFVLSLFKRRIKAVFLKKK